MQRWAGLFVILWGLSGGARSLLAATVVAQSSDVRVVANSDKFSAYFETASGDDLLYFDPGFAALGGTSRMVFNLNGTAVDMQTSVAPSAVIIPVTAVGSGLGAYVEMAKHFGTASAGLTYGVRYTIVADPHTGSGAGYVQIKATVTNNGSVSAQVGMRMLLDVQLIDTSVDDAFLSIDNGLNSYTVNTMLQAATTPIPSDWWTYDRNPSPRLVGRGVTWGNAFGQAATQPDAIEFCHWDEVNAEGFYEPHPQPGQALSSYTRADTAVVLWYTNDGLAGDVIGGSTVGNDYSLPAGKTLEFVTYYGVNPQSLGLTPTPYFSYTPTLTLSATPTITPSPSISPTFTVSPTITQTPSISPTYSASPTFSVSPTQSPSWTPSPTFSISPTNTPTPTRTPSFSATPSATPSPTATASPSATPSFSASPTWTVSPTFTISLTPSVSPTFSITPTPEPPRLILSPKPPSPNPSQGLGVWLPYVLNKAATVRIRVFTVAGELVRALSPVDSPGGANEQFWDQRNESGALVASGVFIYRIQAQDARDEKVVFQKLAVVR